MTQRQSCVVFTIGLQPKKNKVCSLSDLVSLTPYLFFLWTMKHKRDYRTTSPARREASTQDTACVWQVLGSNTDARPLPCACGWCNMTSWRRMHQLLRLLKGHRIKTLKDKYTHNSVTFTSLYLIRQANRSPSSYVAIHLRILRQGCQKRTKCGYLISVNKPFIDSFS